MNHKETLDYSLIEAQHIIIISNHYIQTVMNKYGRTSRNNTEPPHSYIHTIHIFMYIIVNWKYTLYTYIPCRYRYIYLYLHLYPFLVCVWWVAHTPPSLHPSYINLPAPTTPCPNREREGGEVHHPLNEATHTTTHIHLHTHRDRSFSSESERESETFWTLNIYLQLSE